MKEDFDKIFKSRLENHSSDYPMDMWDNIEKAIHPEKRRNYLWLYSLIFLGISAIGLGIIFWQGDNSISTADGTLSELSTTLLDSAKSAKESTEENSTTRRENSEEFRKESEIKGIDDNEGVQDTKLIEIENQDTDKERLYKNEIGDNNKPASMRPALSTERLQIPQADVETISIKKQKVRNKRKIIFTEPILSSDLLNSKNRNNLISSNRIQSNANEANIASGLSTKLNERLEALSPLSFSRLEDSEKVELDLMLSAKLGKSTDCPSWVKDKMGLYLEAYYSPEVALRSLTAKFRDSTTMQNQFDRNNTESTLLSYSFGVRAMFLTPKGISFKIGLNYSQINEKFTYQDPESVREIMVIDTDLVTGEVLDTFTYFEYGSTKEEIINRYKSFDFPILIGYESYKGKKWSYSFDAGIYLNLQSEQRGKFIDPNGEKVWFTSDADNNYKAFKNSLGLSVYASAGLMYHWVEGIDFFAKPSVRYYSESFTLGDYPLNQNYIVLGIQSGIRYRF